MFSLPDQFSRVVWSGAAEESLIEVDLIAPVATPQPRLVGPERSARFHAVVLDVVDAVAAADLKARSARRAKRCTGPTAERFARASVSFGVSKMRAEPCTSFVPRFVTMLSVTPGTAIEGSDPPVVACISWNASKS